MAGRLQGKRCIVTGASKGIGRAIASRFAAEGARVLATARTRPEPALPAGVVFLPGDIAAPDQGERLVAACLDAFGGLDVLVNNAAMQIEKTVVATGLEEWERIFAVNVRGVFLACRAAIPAMAAGGGGAIVNIGSYDGFVADPALAAYGATKGAVHALSRAMAVDHGGERIRCNAICPGWIETDMMRAYLAAMPDPQAAARGLAANQPAGRIGQPDDIAALATFLASDEAAFVTGQLLVCDGGLTAQAPQPRT